MGIITKVDIMRNDRRNVIVEKTFNFSVRLIEFCDELYRNKNFVIGKQLLKSGTSIGANVNEAQNAESIKDFVHKLKISLKETDETIYWLSLCKASKKLAYDPVLMKEAEQIMKILSKIVSSTIKRY